MLLAPLPSFGSGFSNSGACHLMVPTIPLVDMEGIVIGLESLAVAKPKSAKQALRVGVINMLSWILRPQA